MKKFCITKDQCVILLLPCVLTVLLWIIISILTHNAIPTDLNVEHWKNFTSKLQYELETSDENQILMYLLIIHALQVVCCVPLMHITKILYGYFFGTVTGGLIACVWEMGLVLVFVTVCVQNTPIKPAPANLQILLSYVEGLRYKKVFYPFLCMFQIASIPLISGTSLVLFRIVTSTEFLLSHLIVTVVMTFKDTFLGELISGADGSTNDIINISVLFVISTFLPTIFTLIIMGIISRSALESMKTPNVELDLDSTVALITPTIPVPS